jgi:hypothetical protein
VGTFNFYGAPSREAGGEPLSFVFELTGGARDVFTGRSTVTIAPLGTPAPGAQTRVGSVEIVER